MSTPVHPRVLVVEDEPVLANTIVAYLERAGLEARTSNEGHRAVQLVERWRPDVVVLDLGLPGLDGIEVSRRIRTFTDCYILMLTARAEERDLLLGLSVGADDYMTKPFSPRELVARIQVLLRRPRTRQADPGQLRRFGPLVIDAQARWVEVDGEQISLTRTEFDILEVLSARPDQVVTREELSEQIWGPAWVGDDHIIDVHMGRLRKKLGDDPSTGQFIVTVRGVGYRMGTGQ